MTLVFDGLVVRANALDRRDLGRSREVVDDGIENQRNALVLERGTADGRNDLARQGAQTQAFLDLGFGELALFEVLVHQLFVGFGRSLDHAGTPLFGQILELRRNFFLAVGHALVVIVPVDGLHLDQVDLTDEVLFSADGELDRNRGMTQALLDLLDDAQEVRALAVHLVDVDDARYAVLVGLTPYGFRLRLYAGGATEHHDSAIQYTQGTLHLDGEVYVAGGVDDVYAIVVVLTARALPEGGNGSGGNGDTALLLLHHPVGGRSAVMHFAQLVVDAGIEQNPLRGGGLARVNVGTDTDITVAVDGCSTGHNKVLGGWAARLEPVVREGLVGLCHTVHVFTLLDCCALAFSGIQQLASQAQSHGLLATLAGEVHQPTHGQGITTGRTDFDRNLVSRTTYAAGLHFDQRSDGIESFFEGFQGIGLAAFLHLVQRTVNDTLGNGFLAAFHHVVHELGQDLASVFRISQHFTLGRYTTSWH